MTTVIRDIPALAFRKSDSHKGDYGKLLIIGGSRGMVGAPTLSANAALRSGAGLVRLSLPESIQLAAATLVPCATTIPLKEDTTGSISDAALPDILNQLSDNDVLAIGPGMGTSHALQVVLSSILTGTNCPIVIDADGLNNLAHIIDSGFKFTSPTILTPHPGEMKRLWSAAFREPLPETRQDQAVMLSKRLNAIVVLKGAETIVTDGRNIYTNTTGNPGMATGGSGDVLTGCIAALLARQDQALSPFNAAVLGVFIHGRAGDLAAAVMTETAMIATDIIDFLSHAWASIE